MLEQQLFRKRDSCAEQTYCEMHKAGNESLAGLPLFQMFENRAVWRMK